MPSSYLQCRLGGGDLSPQSHCHTHLKSLNALLHSSFYQQFAYCISSLLVIMVSSQSVNPSQYIYIPSLFSVPFCEVVALLV